VDETSRLPQFLDSHLTDGEVVSCQAYAPAALYQQEDSLVLISVRA
jgi:hypothetical protein